MDGVLDIKEISRDETLSEDEVVVGTSTSYMVILHHAANPLVCILNCQLIECTIFVFGSYRTPVYWDWHVAVLRCYYLPHHQVVSLVK